MTEPEFRNAIIEEAKSWIGTPYRSSARLKGQGCNCAQFLYGVALGSKVLPADSPEPRWFTNQFAANTKEERLINYVMAYGAVEVPESDAKPGDIVLYHSGLSHGHAAILIDLEGPNIVHCLYPAGCQMNRIDSGHLGSFSKRFFSLWKEDK